MKKIFVSMVFAFSALVMLNGCIVSDKKLTNIVQQVIVDEEKKIGNELVITKFDLYEQADKNYKGVLKGTLNGKSVEYDVTVNDEGSNYDIDWTLR